MTSPSPNTIDATDRFARALTSRLSESADEVPHEVLERLRVARGQALAKRKTALAKAAPRVSVLSKVFALQTESGKHTDGGWGKFASFIPLLALVVGLIVIVMVQEEWRATEIADVDTELLTDELPPAAYTDPGFAQFIESSQNR